MWIDLEPRPKRLRRDRPALLVVFNSRHFQQTLRQSAFEGRLHQFRDALLFGGPRGELPFAQMWERAVEQFLRQEIGTRLALRAGTTTEMGFSEHRITEIGDKVVVTPQYRGAPGLRRLAIEDDTSRNIFA